MLLVTLACSLSGWNPYVGRQTRERRPSSALHALSAVLTIPVVHLTSLNERLLLSSSDLRWVRGRSCSGYFSTLSLYAVCVVTTSHVSTAIGFSSSAPAAGTRLPLEWMGRAVGYLYGVASSLLPLPISGPLFATVPSTPEPLLCLGALHRGMWLVNRDCSRCCANTALRASMSRRLVVPNSRRKRRS